NEFFRRASFICHEVELAAASTKGAEARGYLRHEWDHPMPMQAIKGSLDVLGDGRLVTVPLPGHTPGTMGVHAGLDRDGEFLLASDAVNLKRNLERDEVPRNTWDAELLLRSYAEVRRIERSGATVICGHDDMQWQSLKRGSEAYE